MDIKKAGRVVMGLAVIALAAGAAIRAHEGHKHEEKTGAPQEPAGEMVTVMGEVLDLSCYLGHASKGKDHKKCAKQCLLQKHVPAGLLAEDGKVYLLVPDHKHEKAFKPVGELAAKHVTVTGKKVALGGLLGILVQKVSAME